MKYYRHWKEIKDPTQAERDLKAALEGGWPCELGPADQIPPEPDDWNTLPSNRHIRADVLRFLLVHANQGGVQPHERGLMLHGAYISGLLDLSYCNIPLRTALRGCRFQNGIDAERSDWAFDLRLKHCATPSLKGAGCKIGGQLACDGAEFHATAGHALNLQSAEIKEDLFLRNAKITGTAQLMGLQLGGQLDCNGAEFNTAGGFALDLQGAEVKGGLYLRGLKSFTGFLDLTAAKTSTLVDNADSIRLLEHMILDGFTYDRISGPTDAKTRLRWLKRGDMKNGEFAPQPYKQLAKVLHDMGHERDAKLVRIKLAQKIRQQERRRLFMRRPLFWTILFFPVLLIPWCILSVSHSVSWLLTGHGYRPEKSLLFLLALWVSAAVVSQLAWDEGSFAPNSAPILTSPEWRMLVRDASIENPALRWTTPDHTDDPKTDWPAIPGKDWETFNAFAYAADVVIPIVEFGQTDAWAPSTERGWWGKQLYWLRWFFTVAGWIVTALGAAALTGIIRRE